MGDFKNSDFNGYAVFEGAILDRIDNHTYKGWLDRHYGLFRIRKINKINNGYHWKKPAEIGTIGFVDLESVKVVSEMSMFQRFKNYFNPKKDHLVNVEALNRHKSQSGSDDIYPLTGEMFTKSN